MVLFASRCFSHTCDRVAGPFLCRSSGWRTNPARMRCTFCFRQNHITIPSLQCVRHSLHCTFGSTLIISQSSVFPLAIIASVDSSLKGSQRTMLLDIILNCFFLRMTVDFQKKRYESSCFAIASPSPEMLKSMFSSSIARLNLFASSRFVSKRSLVVDEETSIVFHTISLHSIFQLLQYNLLEVL